MGTKDHRYAVGLCSECHRRQTAHGDEEDWWLTRAKRDPISLARILWSITGETEMAEAIIRGDKAGEGK